MQKWNIIQILIKLPPQKLVNALLLLFIAASLTSNSIVAMFFVNDEKQKDIAHKVEINYYKQLLKTKDSIQFIKDKDYFNFIKEQTEIGYSHKSELDSLKLIIKK